jgi:hypothetical protein
VEFIQEDILSLQAAWKARILRLPAAKTTYFLYLPATSLLLRHFVFMPLRRFAVLLLRCFVFGRNAPVGLPP